MNRVHWTDVPYSFEELNLLFLFELLQDFSLLGESSGLRLFVDGFAVGDDFENSPGARDETGFDAQFLLDFIRQTGGGRLVVSSASVFDGDLHGYLQFAFKIYILY